MKASPPSLLPAILSITLTIGSGLILTCHPVQAMDHILQTPRYLGHALQQLEHAVLFGAQQLPRQE